MRINYVFNLKRLWSSKNLEITTWILNEREQFQLELIILVKSRLKSLQWSSGLLKLGKFWILTDFHSIFFLHVSTASFYRFEFFIISLFLMVFEKFERNSCPLWKWNTIQIAWFKLRVHSRSGSQTVQEHATNLLCGHV